MSHFSYPMFGNYAQARTPLEAGLNLEEWEHELKDYPDQMIIQYLKFGFPLSLVNPNRLSSTFIKNHHSAIQFSDAVQSYLDNEVALGAMLGPVNEVQSSYFHCSPLLTRPKDMR